MPLSWTATPLCGAASSPACEAAMALGKRSAEPGVGSFLRDPERLAGERGPGRERLDAPVVWAVALAGRAVLVDHDVAQLTGRTDPTAVELAAQDQPAADPGADRHDHRFVRPARGAGAVLGERRHVGVVVDEHGQTEPLGHDRAERDVGKWEIDCNHTTAATLIHQARDPEAHRRDLAARRSPRFFDCFNGDIEDRGLIQPGERALYAVMD